jgi:hypothetical protein
VGRVRLAASGDAAVDLDWSEGDVLEVLLLIDCEGFDAVDVEDIVALVLAAMIVPELSKEKT